MVIRNRQLRQFAFLACFLTLAFITFSKIIELKEAPLQQEKSVPAIVENDGEHSSLKTTEYKTTQDGTFVTVTWSGLCSVLTGSKLDLTKLSKGGKDANQYNLINEFIETVERVADDTLDFLANSKTNIDLVDPKVVHAVCLDAVTSGSVKFAKVGGLADVRLDAFYPNMKSASPEFEILYDGKVQIISTGEDSSKTSDYVKPNVKMAYLVVIDKDDYHIPERIQKMISWLRPEDKEVHDFVLIQVDEKLTNVFSSVEKYLLKTRPVHVGLLMHRFSMDSIGIQSTLAKVDGFFALTHLAVWDFVMNLSGFEYPVHTTNYIWSKLEKNSIYMNTWDDEFIASKETDMHFFEARDGSFAAIDSDHMRKFSLYHHAASKKHSIAHGIQKKKQSPWMIFPYDYVKFLTKDDAKFRMLLAFLETNHNTNDYVFAAHLLRDTDKNEREEIRKKRDFWKTRIVNDNFRFHLPRTDSKILAELWEFEDDLEDLESYMRTKEVFFVNNVDILDGNTLIDISE